MPNCFVINSNIEKGDGGYLGEEKLILLNINPIQTSLVFLLPRIGGWGASEALHL